MRLLVEMWVGDGLCDGGSGDRSKQCTKHATGVHALQALR